MKKTVEKENLEVKNNENIEELVKPEYSHKSLQAIEDERALFWNSYRKHNTFKTVITMFCLAAIIAAFLIMKNQDIGTYISFGAAILFLGIAYGYSLYVKKKFDKRMKEYFKLYFNSINDFAFSSKGFKDVELQEPGKISLEDFSASLLYKDVVEAGSRGLTFYKYNNVEMSIVDCAGNVKAEKRMKPVFVGKMVRGTSSYKGDKPIIVYLKGNDRALPPTNTENIKLVEQDEKMNIYTDYKDWKKVLSTDVMKLISSIKTDKILVDLAISIYSGKVFIMMGYDEPLMVLPLQNKFNENPSKKFKSDIQVVSKLVEALGK